MKGKYLITTNDWFIGPDGSDYKAAWGDVVIMEDKFLGLTTNRNSTNWYARVGTENNHIIIAGCQIHYAVRCEKKPHTFSNRVWSTEGGKLNKMEIPNRIYIADE